MIFCRTLGPLEVTVDGKHAPRELLWRKHQALIVYLARSPKRTRTRDHLVGLLWGEKPEPAARHSLNEALRVLRRHAGEGAIETHGDQVRLAGDAVQLDVDLLEAQAAAGDWASAARWIAGEFMEGFSVPEASTLEDWLAAERMAWRQRGVEVLTRYTETLLTAGRVQEALEVAQRARGLDPLSDAAARAALTGLALAGDRAGALELYDGFAHRLESELQIEPDEETHALAERIRSQRTWRLPAPAAAAVGAQSRRAPLVGRAEELGRLLEAWTTCRSGRRASAAILEGDVGTGKTRLVDELVGRARLDGGVIALARAVEADVSAPWSGLAALVRGGLVDAPRIAAAPPAALAAFAPHVPEWADRFGHVLRDEEPLAGGRAFSEILRTTMGAAPIVCGVDDAHWLDRDSLLALAAACRDHARAPLFLVLTHVPHPRRDELDDLRAQVGRDLAGTLVSLEPLTTDALRELARWALPRYTDIETDRVTRRILADSAGIPLLAVELFHAVALGLDLQGAPGAWPEPFRTLEQTPPSDLPDSVVAAIRVGFRRLSAHAQSALAAASVLGERVTPELVARATRLSPDDVAGALDELEWQRWLAAESRGYSFVARIVREVVARDMLTHGQRQRILDAAGDPPA
jgi:DNA-binding SARP family transcriptional activator